jgi:predicted RND superfamily exporter protein
VLERVARFVARRAGACVTVILLVTVVAALQIVDPTSGKLRIDVDASGNALLPHDDPAVEYYRGWREKFGSDETLVVALAADELFTADRLRRVARITARVGQIEGVERVVSLSTALHIHGTAEGLEIGPFFETVPEDAQALARIKNEVLGNPIYAGNLISPDATATALLVYLREMTERELLASGLVDTIRVAAEEESGDALRVWVTGTPALKVVTTRLMEQSSSRTLPLTMIVLGGVLVFAFRTVRGVLVPVVAILISIVCTLGFVARYGGTLNLVTSLVPPLLATLGLSYSMHVVSEYYQTLRRHGGSRPYREQIGETLHEVMLPEILCGITTGVGFISLAISPLDAIREFGIYSTVGVVITTLVSLVFIPAAFAVLGPPRGLTRRAPRGEGEDAFERVAGSVARFDVRNRRGIFVAAAILLAIALAGVPRIQVGTEHINKFPPDAPVRLDFEAVNERFGGANPFYVVLETDYPEGFKEPVNLREVESLQRWLESQPEIGGTTSIVDYLKLINRGFHENAPEWLAIPESRKLASQLLLFGANEEIERFADTRFQTANVMVRSKAIDSTEIAALVSRIDARLAELPSHLRARVTGNPVLINATIDAVMGGQLSSLFTALAPIYLVLAALFVSFRTGLLALLPNVMPIAAYYGALGWSGVNLAPGTSLVGPMVLGIAVDDTFHYMERFRGDAQRLADDRAAVVTALKASLRPVTLTATTLCLGFLTFLWSDLRTQAEVGAMAAFTLGFALLCDLFLTPALCAGLRIATLWDTLTLDLGPSPQTTIPLLAGLTPRRARLVAQMSSLLDLPAGQQLIRVGEPGRELYVVIDGRLRAWVERDGGPVELATHSRGDVVGEVGLFQHRRTANVDVTERARVLRITPESLDHLARRYPRIAARVHRNLGEILASRLAKLTGRLH